MIDASPHENGTALLAAKRYQLDDRTPYIYKTRDFGKTWTKIVNGIADADYVHVVREDPKRAGLLYAGTEHGMYISFDDGSNWQSLRLNLPDTQVADLTVQGDDLVIATHGRSFWVLDDIDILRQAQPNLSASALHLFAPDQAVRSFHPAAIDYYLKQDADKITVDILDSTGAVVRTFTASAEEEKKKKKANTDNDESEFSGPRQQPPGRKAGTNRFTWDLRYPGATVFEGMVLWGARAEQGPLAVPGKYQVRVSASGSVETQPFTLILDPREHVTQADLEAQFKLACQVRDEVSKADEMVIQIRKINKDLKDRADQAKDEKVANAGAALRDRLSTIEEELYQVRNRANEDPLNFPIKLNNIIAALARTIETGDYPPTDQDYEVFRVLTQRLNTVEAKYNDALQKDLANFNQLLAARKLPEVRTSSGTDQQ